MKEYLRNKKSHKETQSRERYGKFSNRSIRIRSEGFKSEGFRAQEQTESSAGQDHKAPSEPKQRPKRSKT